MANSLLQLDGSVRIQATGDVQKTPQVEILGYSGGLMSVSGWGAIAIDLGGLEASSQVPILVDHDLSLAGIVGHGTPIVESGRLVVRGQLSKTGEAAQQIVELAKSGLTFQASVGVEPSKSQRIAPGEAVVINGRTIKSKSGFTLVKSGTLREISIVAVGADSETSVSIAAKAKQQIQNQGIESMSITNQNMNETTGEAPEELKAAWDKTGLTDRQRIQARADAATIKDSNIQAEARDLLFATASGNLTFNDYDTALVRLENRDLHLQVIRAEMPKAQSIHGSDRDMHTNKNVIEAAFCLSAGLPDPEKHFDERTLDAAAGRGFRGYGLQRLLIQAACSAGYSGTFGERIHSGNIKEILSYALPSSPIRAASGFSGIDVSGIISNVANKILLSGFDSIPQKWREIASIRSVPNFQEVTAYRLTADLEYEEVPPTGEIKHGTLGEESYSMQAKTYAKMLTLPRTDIINDDLGAFNDLRTRLGFGAAQKINRVFWTLWVNNVTFFTSDRNNYQEGSGTALDESGLNTAVKLFREMQGPDGSELDLEPAILLVPSDLEATAAILYNSTEVRDITASSERPTANIYHKRFTPVCVPQLGNSAYTGSSSTAWYLLADPAILATASMCFLDGRQAPIVESADADFNILGISLRGYHDFGVAMNEYRGGVKSKGIN